MTESPCPKCSGSMQAGLQIDELELNSFRQTCWVPGEPETRSAELFGITLYKERKLDVHKEDIRPIHTLRCRKCGFLENYAPDLPPESEKT